jgi:hypothetical protein
MFLWLNEWPGCLEIQWPSKLRGTFAVLDVLGIRKIRQLFPLVVLAEIPFGDIYFVDQ